MIEYTSNLQNSKPAPTAKFLYHYPLKNVPGFSMVGMRVTFPPGSNSPPHRHGGASVGAVVISGNSYNKMNNEPTKLCTKNESWYEAPGCHHKTSANASNDEELELIATFVVETKVLTEQGPQALVQVDEEYKDVVIAVI